MGGNVVAKAVRYFGFFAVALSLCAVVILLGLFRLGQMYWRPQIPQRRHVDMSGKVEEPRMHGDDFALLATFADTALTPSVVLLCEEMSEQKRHTFDDTKDASSRVKGRENLILGKLTREALEKLELDNIEERDRVERSQRLHLTIVLALKVLI